MRNFLKLFSALALALSLGACASDCDEDAKNAVETDESEGSIIGVDYKEEPLISYVRCRYLSDAQTRTIGEVFTGDEYTYGQLTIRTQPKKRAGMYFFVMFDYGPDDISLASQIELSVDSSDSAHPRTFTFVVPQTHNVIREIKLGITGSDWTNAAAKVNAWKLVVKSPAGKIITQKQSWLWSLRDKNGKQLSNPELIKKGIQTKSKNAEEKELQQAETKQAEGGKISEVKEQPASQPKSEVKAQ